MKTMVLLALQVSVVTTVFGFALDATWNDLLYLVRRPGLLVRSLLSVFVIMPVLALLLVRWFDFRPMTEIVVIALAISPVPPLLPMKQTKAGGSVPYGLGLMMILALVSIVAIPGILAILDPFFAAPLTMRPAAVARIVLISTVLPLLAGSAVRALRPALADRLARPVGLIAKFLLPIAVLILLAAVASSMWALVGTGTIFVMAAFSVIGTGARAPARRPRPGPFGRAGAVHGVPPSGARLRRRDRKLPGSAFRSDDPLVFDRQHGRRHPVSVMAAAPGMSDILSP